MHSFHCIAGPRSASPDTEQNGNGVACYAGTGPETSDRGAVFWVHAARAFRAEAGHVVAVGTARLSDPDDLIAQLNGRGRAAIGDLALIAHAFEQFGDRVLDSLVGDFAVVLWNRRTRELVAIRDAFGVHPLYMQPSGDHVAFASHASILGQKGAWNRTYLADFLIDGPATTSQTVFLNVDMVPAASRVHWCPGRRPVATRYWDPTEIPVQPQLPLSRAAEQFRELLCRGVRAATRESEPVWAHLSGGLDSSSIVCVADHLAREGCGAPLGGTITFADSLGTGDERDFVRDVVQRTGVRNEVLVDLWPWMEDNQAPPVTDQPVTAFPFYARDRRIDTMVTAAGGRILLSGLGSDHYLGIDPPQISDLLWQGHLGRGLRLAIERATTERRSLWKCLYRHGLYPALPEWARARHLPKYDRIPRWIDPDLVEELHLRDRVLYLRRLGGRIGHKVQHATSVALTSIAHDFQRWTTDERTELRYPFLYRPLVEFALTLPPEMREQPLRAKRILREALSALLPPSVRERTGKGGISVRIRWALDREQVLIDELTAQPILAELGIVRAHELSRYVRRARRGKRMSIWLLFQVLSLESWLRVVSGRWPRAG